MNRIITRTILLLSIVSLLNDVSSEMLIPILPVYLTSVGFSVGWIGLLEGLAEAVAGFSKMYFGQQSDQSARRLPFVRGGYLLSAFAKPALGLSRLIGVIFLARTGDKIGKGLRTAARDAMLSDEARAENKGAVFGFHRAFDTAGATLGPAITLLFLYFLPGRYHQLFLFAAIPAFASVAFTWLVKEKKRATPTRKIRAPWFAGFLYWKKSTPSFRKLVIPLLLFGLANSSDAFLLLQTKVLVKNDLAVIGLYILYNFVYAASSYPLGRLADKLGLKNMLVTGLFLFAAVYSGMGLCRSTWLLVLLFFGYGLYAAATEGISKALISNLVPKTETASAIGFYTGWNSLFALLASVLAGLVWTWTHAPEATFLLSGILTLLAAIYLLFTRLQHYPTEPVPSLLQE